MKTKLIEKAKAYAIQCHTETNHLYDGKPYHKKHLQPVVDEVKRWLEIYSFTDIAKEVAIAAAWCHDVIEDTRQTVNDVRTNTNKSVAEIAYALTNEKGRNREERANDKYYQGIVDCFKDHPDFKHLAILIKLCDRICNVEANIDKVKLILDSNPYAGSMFSKYQEEHWKFCGALMKDGLVFPDTVLKLTKLTFNLQEK